MLPEENKIINQSYRCDIYFRWELSLLWILSATIASIVLGTIGDSSYSIDISPKAYVATINDSYR